MGQGLLLAALLCAASCADASRIFFPEEQPGQCVTTEGRLGVCVSASARRCALYPTIGHLLTARPKVCNFIANDPVICCPPEHVLPDTLGQQPEPATEPEDANELVGTPDETSSTTTEAVPVTNEDITPEVDVLDLVGTVPELPVDTESEGLIAVEPIPPTEAPQPDDTKSGEPEETTEQSTPTDLDELLAPASTCGVKSPQEAFLLPNNTYRSERPADDSNWRSTPLGNNPWTALVGLRAEGGAVGWICSGALVSDRLVVTAAHCVVLGGSPDRLAVRLGENDLRTSTDGDTVERGVVAIRRHPDYIPPAQRHDLALLLLDEPVVMSDRVQPVCLPPSPDLAQELPPTNNTLRLPAFDLSGDLTGSDPAGRGRLTAPFGRISPLRACAEPLRQLPHADFIFPGGVRADTETCVLPAAGDACVHDSGGPVVLEDDDGAPATLLALRLIGGCQPGQPELVLRIDHYTEFILQTEQELLEQEKAELVEGSGAVAVEGSGQEE